MPFERPGGAGDRRGAWRRRSGRGAGLEPGGRPGRRLRYRRSRWPKRSPPASASRAARPRPSAMTLRSPDVCDRLVQAVVDRFGRPGYPGQQRGHLPAHPAGRHDRGRFRPHHRRQPEVGLFPLPRRGRIMQAGGWGRIVNVSSTGGRTGGLFNATVYSASKAGVISMTKAFARHVRGQPYPGQLRGAGQRQHAPDGATSRRMPWRRRSAGCRWAGCPSRTRSPR